MAFENGSLLAESTRFAAKDQLVAPTWTWNAWRPTACGRTPSASQARATPREVARFRTIEFFLPGVEGFLICKEKSRDSPTCPPTRRRASRAARRFYRIQAAGLATRMRATGTGSW
jgi:NAD+ synthase (glutamine-hydrolysing)